LADWVTISSLATAGGTLVLAVATFSSVRSANRSARVAELSLLAAQRPVLIPSREDDLPERVMFGEGHRVTVEGHGGVVEVADGSIYLAAGLRNAGSGIAVLHGWRVAPQIEGTRHQRPELEEFRRQQRACTSLPVAPDSGRVRSATRPTPATRRSSPSRGRGRG